MRKAIFGNLALLLAPAMILLSGCGGLVHARPSNDAFSISPGAAAIDTSCTGCNAVNAHGKAVLQFAATLTGGGAAEVLWAVSGGDRTAGAGTIDPSGRYAPPAYLTADRVQVLVTATLASDPSLTAAAVLDLTPGFLQPLTPENAALGANGSVTISGVLAEAGGSTAISFALARTPGGAPEAAASALGALTPASCQHSSQSYTVCSVTYTAPPTVASTGAAYVVATVQNYGLGPAARVAAPVLLNTAGVTSNPAAHQAQMPTTVFLGASGSNNSDYDTKGNRVQDCCGGTLGALVEDSTGRNYILSNNHVLARSDHAAYGDAIVQPGLIDNNCAPLGVNSGIAPVATLTGWLPLAAKSTNADAALALVTSRTVDTSGSILELGARQPDGTLAAAPPGVTSSGGKGETASLALRVAKSGRTTGLTCGSVTALDLDITVDYYEDCAETRPYLTKTFTRQIGLSGNAFSDAGDSGALVVDAANAEPVGLFFAGGLDSAGVTQGVATPAPELLSELDALSGGISYSYVGAADHPVSCLSYGDSAISSAQELSLSPAENARLRSALAEAHALLNPSAGVLGVAAGKSSDHPGEAALIVYVDEALNPVLPSTFAGVRTLPIAASAYAVAFGLAPHAPPHNAAIALSSAALAQAIAVKQSAAAALLRRNPAFFAVGVGQSLDNLREAALIIYVDRRRIPAQLPALVHGLRARYIFMDRMHVTRSWAAPSSAPRCLPHPAQDPPGSFDPRDLLRTLRLKLN
jgi:hypothetical protein